MLFKYELDCSWNYTPVFFGMSWTVRTHRVSFTTTGLAIGKDAHIVTIKKGFYQMLDFIVDIHLGFFLAKNAIKVERVLNSFLVIDHFEFNLLIPLNI